MPADDNTVVFDTVVSDAVPHQPWWRRSARRHPKRHGHSYAVAGVVLVFVGLFGVGAGLGLFVGAPALPSLSLAHARPSGPAADAMARSTPTRIEIPSIGVSAPIMTVGLAADGTIGTPPLDNSNLAAWYSGGPAPGELGPAIIVGHVDGPNGESVFYKLGTLKPGETVTMALADHRTAQFSIYSVEYYPKDKFPGTRVYDDYSRPGLRIITCGGAFLGGSTGYADNIVVYATLNVRG
jgi:sortase family protein